MHIKRFTLLILILCFNLNAGEYKHHQQPKPVLFHNAVKNLSQAVLDVEPNNGAILAESAIIGESGTVIAQICANKEIEYLEEGCESTSDNSAVDIHFGFAENSQHTIYYRPNIVIDQFKLKQAVVINGKIQQLIFEDSFSYELFFIRNNKQLESIIKNKLKKGNLSQTMTC